MNVQILLYDGFDELDGIGPYEVFDYVGQYVDGDVSTAYVTLTGTDQVTASHGTRIEPDGVLPDPAAPDVASEQLPDLLVVPGGGWNDRDPAASAWAEAQRGKVPAALADYHDAGVRIAAVCTGTMLLAEAGITDDRRAVTHASAAEELRETGATVVDARGVDDGDVVTAGGITSGLDLALYLVEQEFAAEVADRVATVIEYERQYDVAES
jgi:transcriptional regulator GlxA family with amidase domain